MLKHNKLMVGVDIGTTSTKAVLFNKKGVALKTENYGYSLNKPDVNTAEQDPDEILQAVNQAIIGVTSDVNSEDLQFISFSAAMHSLIAIDENNRPLTQCITWADNRSASWAEYIKDSPQGHDIYKRTGTPIHPMSPLSKILWLKKEFPEIDAKTKKYLGIKEYIFLNYFGVCHVDISIASATGLMNLNDLVWDQGALDFIELSVDKLPEIVPTTKIYHNLSETYQNRFKFKQKVPFIIGASDGVLSNLGVGAIEEGEVAITIGTSGAVRTIIDQPRTDEKGRIFCYALTEDHWVIGGPVNNGGVIFRWLKETLGEKEVAVAKGSDKNVYDLLTELAKDVPAGANGLLFHPFLTGERAPFWNANMRGSFLGLNFNHEKRHMVRAVLEGVMFNLYSVLIALNEVMDTSVHAVKATGGFSQSALWRQIMADIFNLKVSIPASYESSCLGACLLGLYAQDEIEDFTVVREMVGATFEHQPQAENQDIYQNLMAIFIRSSRLLETEYENLAKLQK